MKSYLYKAVMPRNPVTGEVLGVKWPNLDMYSFLAAMAVIIPITIWAVSQILQ